MRNCAFLKICRYNSSLSPFPSPSKEAPPPLPTGWRQEFEGRFDRQPPVDGVIDDYCIVYMAETFHFRKFLVTWEGKGAGISW